jgi:ribonuclease Z
MKPQFHPALVNEPFGDPGVYVDCLFEKRAVLFDLGDIAALAPRKIMRLTDVFVSHTHMDHFMGFDWLLRLRLGRDLKLRLCGPPGFLDQVEHRLAAYTWNLVENYDTDFALEVMEVDPSGGARRAVFHCKQAFRRQEERAFPLQDGVLLDEESFLVRGAHLDHKIPCLAFALEEKEHLNVWKNRLDEMGLPTGPWLQDVKRAVRAGLPDDTSIRAWWREGTVGHERFLSLGEIKEKILQIVPGQKIAYVTDVVYHEDNARRIEALAKNADVLFIETPFLERDAERAASRYHLTARQAGTLARRAGVKTVVPFHFSPRYDDRGEQLRHEMAQAFSLTDE